MQCRRPPNKTHASHAAQALASQGSHITGSMSIHPRRLTLHVQRSSPSSKERIVRDHAGSVVSMTGRMQQKGKRLWVEVAPYCGSNWKRLPSSCTWRPYATPPRSAIDVLPYARPSRKAFLRISPWLRACFMCSFFTRVWQPWCNLRTLERDGRSCALLVFGFRIRLGRCHEVERTYSSSIFTPSNSIVFNCACISSPLYYCYGRGFHRLALAV